MIKPENKGFNINNKIKLIIENLEIPQSEVVVHQIENYDTIRKNMHMRHLLGHTITSKLKVTVKKLNELNSAGNIQFLTFFLE